ncbi:glycosyltransferase [Methylophaga sp.]|uniref:glycosyltransferase n=1 Tax=Methylophaga sp. TaxID=2024840 RepID=UPI003F6FD630
MLNIDIGVFAYNEENNIKQIIESILKQDLFSSDSYSVKLYILANGCNDNTVKIATSLINEFRSFEIIELPIGGKSRTWNRFVHEISRKSSDQLIFCDSDIFFTKQTILKDLCEKLNNKLSLKAVSSRPVKDLTRMNHKLSFTDRLIASSADGLNNWQTSICGQLYALKTDTARSIYLPIGLPVEDGYVRAMIVTDDMTSSENLSKISGDEDIYHLYKSERTIKNLINHQSRIVIGSAINYIVFEELRQKKFTKKEMIEFTKSISENENWLEELIKLKLPSKKYGWVPWHFLTKRFNYVILSPRRLLKPKKIILLILGVGFDLIVFIKAQYKMARGIGAGHW